MRRLKVILVALMAFPGIAAACVDTRSGNFCEQHEDIVQTAYGNNLKLVRFYNSGEAKRDGWFGYGWGTPFETRLSVLPDGVILVKSPQERSTDRYARPGPDGRSSSEECSVAGVTRTDAGYRRITCQRKVDYFDLQGRLLSHEEDHYRYSVHYDGDRPDRIDDSAGQKLLLKWSSSGHVVEVSKADEKPAAKYRYDGSGNLVAASIYGADSGEDSCRDSVQCEYGYAYDVDHRLTRVESAGSEPHLMQYNMQGRIAVESTPDGVRDAYEYRADSSALNLWVLRKRDYGEGVVVIGEAEYLLRKGADGVERLVLVVKVRQGVREEILLDEHERVRAVHRSDGTFLELAYDSVTGKVATSKTESARRAYRYDKRGNLIQASDSDGKRVRMTYDDRNHISRMVDSNPAKHVRRELSFVYNEAGKPVKISMVGKGSIDVEYDAQGEISNVASKQGAKMALEVTSAFQSLLSLVKYETVNLCL